MMRRMMASSGFASMSIRGRAGPIPASTGKGCISRSGLGGLGLGEKLLALSMGRDSPLMWRELELKSTMGLVLLLLMLLSLLLLLMSMLLLLWLLLLLLLLLV